MKICIIAGLIGFVTGMLFIGVIFLIRRASKKRKAYLKLSTLTNGKYKLEISNTKEEGTFYLFPKKVDLLHFLRKGPFPKNTFISFDKKGVCIGELIESLNNDTSHSQN